MPEENKNQAMTAEDVEQVKAIEAVTDASVRAILVLVHTFLVTAMNTKIKDGETLRKPTAEETLLITVGLMENAIKNLGGKPVPQKE